MAITFVTPVALTLSTSAAWTDADVSAYVPAGATGVILHLTNIYTSADLPIGLRKNGSTDNRFPNMYSGGGTGAGHGA